MKKGAYVDDLVEFMQHDLSCQCAPCLRVKASARRGFARWKREGVYEERVKAVEKMAIDSLFIVRSK